LRRWCPGLLRLPRLFVIAGRGLFALLSGGQNIKDRAILRIQIATHSIPDLICRDVEIDL
jgi:hypothetical protein